MLVKFNVILETYRYPHLHIFLVEAINKIYYLPSIKKQIPIDYGKTESSTYLIFRTYKRS